MQGSHRDEDRVGEEFDVEKAVSDVQIELEQAEQGDAANGVPQKEPGCDNKEPTARNTGIGTASLWMLLRTYPHLLIGPVSLFCLLAGPCTFAVVYSTNHSYEMEQRQARDAALSASEGIAKQLSSASRTVLTQVALVKVNPDWPSLSGSQFDTLSKEMFRQSSQQGDEEYTLPLTALAYLPFGRVRAERSKYSDSNATFDAFSPDMDGYRPFEKMNVGLHVDGPFLLNGQTVHSFSAGYPIFISDTDEDESWSHPDNISHPTGCPGPPCFNPETREKFWGFAEAIVNAEPTLAGNNVHLKRLLSEDLSYMLTISNPDWDPGSKVVKVSGGQHPQKVSVNVTVDLPGNTWALSVYAPRLDEIVNLRKGLLALVVVMAFVFSGLLSLLLLSFKRASVLLHEQLVTNKLLHEERESREALLGRQLDLIACFEQGINAKKKRSTETLNTLEKIEHAKQALSNATKSRNEDIAVLQILAEGSFGKVYKGMWRGSDVAVKIIMLPGNMSGRKKREKMIIWEAAISSSLVHPNICQTYHYRIKPVKESTRPASLAGGSVLGCSDKSKSGVLSSQKDGTSEASGPEEVHSYEVHLVLEYCDGKSLRDALDAGLFVTPQGMNYAAQLDCAMDVAKAMLHLHCHNVLHLDLKTRNVLLASSATEGKGVTCKVSDFGLSVRMDLSETHVSSLFQGTLTHMAPETLLKGTCSKAADVYAFGIIMWELYTGDAPFSNVPPVLLGHSIVRENSRPPWPSVVPKGYRDLASACWDPNPDARPSFESILEELTRLRRELGIPTAPLQPYPVQQPKEGRPPHFQETFGPSSQSSLTQLQSWTFNSGAPAGASLSPSQAAHLQQAWMQPQGSKGKLQETDPSLCPSQASLLEEAWIQPQGNEGCLQEENPRLTPSQAALLVQAWMRPRENEGRPEAKDPPSAPPQEAHLHPEDTSALSPASPDSNKVALVLPEGASPASKEEEETGSASPVHGKHEEDGLNVPQPGVWERGQERPCPSHDLGPAPPMLGSQTINKPPDPLILGQALLPLPMTLMHLCSTSAAVVAAEAASAKGVVPAPLVAAQGPCIIGMNWKRRRGADSM